MKKYILAIDQGTTSSRVVLYDVKFKIKNIEQKEFKQYFPNDGWVEHDAEEIWKDVKRLIFQTIKKNNLKPSQIISIGITNQRETTVLWDKKTGKPIYKAIVWQDRRTADYCDQLKLKKKDKIIQKITGLVLDPYFSATKIRWILNKTSKNNTDQNSNILFGTIDTWLLWKLTEGKSHYTDITNASRTMIYDSKNNIINAPNDKVVVVQGLEDYIIIDNKNTLLICKKENEQQSKQFVSDIKRDKGDEYV